MIVMKGIFLKLMFNVLKTYKTFTMIYLICLKERKLKTLLSLLCYTHKKFKTSIKSWIEKGA